ncbi:MAG: 4-hydroxythreonine-4-phosphate dehydrogenase PdxA [Kiritimatiellae bacterium]|nr:4-hydroxythreonine-4-phosphate dehydrogenase PdxA [Kiritimatiellia bacterium]MDD5519636.1 4-hydroxythreonine-4-phosphate dehydrogenase PdxA [Kiritimatiellia bacterium]
MNKPVIGITMGDPAGVGPELCLRVLKEKQVLQKCRPVIFGDAAVLERVARLCRLSRPRFVVPIEKWTKMKRASDFPLVVDCQSIEAEHVLPGKINPACGSASYRYIEAAVSSAKCGKIAAIATAPINKESLNLAGIKYPGHTEILAKLTHARRVCMMMASNEIKVSLVTIHTGLARVPEQLSVKGIVDVIELTDGVIRRLGKTKPRIAVCALNPHGGENGLFGTEEKKIIKPAIERARKKGIAVTGPVVPDTAFLPQKRREFDAYVVMYHDQGLIPFKMLAFDNGVNITLGLPIVRTSVDHGTAFDIAWQGKASASSMVQSILWAAKLAK